MSIITKTLKAMQTPFPSALLNPYELEEIAAEINANQAKVPCPSPGAVEEFTKQNTAPVAKKLEEVANELYNQIHSVPIAVNELADEAFAQMQATPPCAVDEMLSTGAQHYDRPKHLIALTSENYRKQQTIIELQSGFSKLQNTHNALRFEYEASQRRLNELESELTEARDTITELQHRVKEASAVETGQLVSLASEAFLKNETVQRLESDLSEMQDTYGALLNKYEESQRRIKELESELEETRDIGAMFRDASAAKISQLQGQLDTGAAKITELEVKVEEQTQGYNNIRAALGTQFERQQERIKKLETALSDAEKNWKDAGTRHDALMAALVRVAAHALDPNSREVNTIALSSALKTGAGLQTLLRNEFDTGLDTF